MPSGAAFFRNRARSDSIIWPTWCGVLLAALLLYTSTANRGPQAQDSGWQQLRIVTEQFEHPYGFPMYHPLQFYLGRLAIHVPSLIPAFAITLVSSVAAAFTIANLTATLVLLTRRRAAALIAVAAFMLSHTFWQHATYTESYALVAACLSGEWLCLALYIRRRRSGYLPLMLLFNGLGIATHLLALLATPVDAVVIWHAWRRRRLSGRSACLAAALWIVGSLPYTVPVVAQIVRTGDLSGTVQTALFSHYRDQVLNIHLSVRLLLLTAGFCFYNFPGLTLPFSVFGIGARRSLPKTIKGFFIAELMIFSIFVLRYSIADQYTFFFPSYMTLTVLAGAGLARLWRRRHARCRRTLLVAATVTALWTPAVYIGTAKIMEHYGALASMVKNKPYRDGYRTFFIPWGRGADEVQRVIETVRENVGSDGLVLIQDRMQSFAIRYAQAVGSLPKSMKILEIAAPPNDELTAERRQAIAQSRSAGQSIVLVPIDRDNPDVDYLDVGWQRIGDLYKVAGVAPASDQPAAP